MIIFMKLGISLLTSWDSKKKFTTTAFHKLLIHVKKNNFRKPEEIEMDFKLLDAAAANQNYVKNDVGEKFEFGREIILQKMHEDEMSRNNWELLINQLEAATDK